MFCFNPTPNSRQRLDLLPRARVRERLKVNPKYVLSKRQQLLTPNDYLQDDNAGLPIHLPQSYP